MAALQSEFESEVEMHSGTLIDVEVTPLSLLPFALETLPRLCKNTHMYSPCVIWDNDAMQAGLVELREEYETAVVEIDTRLGQVETTDADGGEVEAQYDYGALG